MSLSAFSAALASLGVCDSAVLECATVVLQAASLPPTSLCSKAGDYSFGPIEAVARFQQSSSRSDGPARATPTVADANWLAQLCATHLARDRSSAWTPQTLGAQILELARQPDFEGGLFDLLGEQGLESMEALVAQRVALTGIRLVDYRRLCDVLASEPPSAPPSSALGRRAGPLMGTGVTVQSESAMRAEKLRQKHENKLDRLRSSQQHLPAGSRVTSDGEALLVARRAPVPGEGGAGGGRRLETADEAIASVSAGFGGVQKMTLPEGTTTTSHPGYQEVYVPAPRPPLPTGPGDAGLVAIASLEPLAQSAFAGIRHLNRLQSHLFAAAYRSNENLLVCAPVRAPAARLL